MDTGAGPVVELEHNVLLNVLRVPRGRHVVDHAGGCVQFPAGVHQCPRPERLALQRVHRGVVQLPHRRDQREGHGLLQRYVQVVVVRRRPVDHEPDDTVGPLHHHRRLRGGPHAWYPLRRRHTVGAHARRVIEVRALDVQVHHQLVVPGADRGQLDFGVVAALCPLEMQVEHLLECHKGFDNKRVMLLQCEVLPELVIRDVDDGVNVLPVERLQACHCAGVWHCPWGK
mmetsp:Transcript_61086/g.172196  ORF Transcript_61086/g.172196 Transcript_61086/m.172196 type:complete len:228 (-) Transcript_61086:81-764(-)